MDKTGDVRKRCRRGQAVESTARDPGVSAPTVRRYRDVGDLSERPRPGRGPQFPTLGELTTKIDSWLEDDVRQWRKQRHTAVRACARLQREEGYEGSHSTVQRHVRWRREQMARERDERDASGCLPPRWLPGERQADFGEAGFRVRGVATRGKCLTVSFPHPDVGLTQVLWGETSECVCQGLRAVFEFVGGVPVRAVLDDATEVGRRFGSEVRCSRMFRLLAAHHGPGHTFANPYSGSGKGNVENMAGTHRRNAFVPMPSLHDVGKFNGRLLGDCAGVSDKRHYRLGTPQLGPFEGDKAALSPLPAARFPCVRWEKGARRRSRRGDVVPGGAHRYNAGPAMAGRGASVGPGAFDATIVDAATGEVVATYERERGEAPASSADPMLRLKLLCVRPGGWRDSVVRGSPPDELVAFLDAADPSDLAAGLRVLRDASEGRGFGAAVEGVLRSLEATGGVDAASVGLSAAVAASGDGRAGCDGRVGLSVYDSAPHLVGGGADDAHEQLGA